MAQENLYKFYNIECDTKSCDTVVLNQITNPTQLKEFAENEQQTLYLEGFLEAQYIIDSLTKQVIYLKIIKGERYEWVSLSKGNVDDGILSKSGFRERFYQSKPFSLSELKTLQAGILKVCENQGFPFASIRLINIEISNFKMSAALHLERNKLITIDSVRIVGSRNIDEKYISNYLGIKENQPYNQRAIEQISRKINEIPFVKEVKAAEVLFTEKYTKLFLFLEEQKANDINGIIGFLPDNETGDITITGDIKLVLFNAFKKGERQEINWRRLQNNTQDLLINLHYPFLFNTNLGLDGILKIYRLDTTFTELNTRLGLNYYLLGGNYVQFFIKNTNSRLISTSDFEFVTTLPEFADISRQMLGLSLNLQKLDYRLNPSRGYSINASISYGTRNIRQNPAINELAYEGVEMRTNQYMIEGVAATYAPISKRMTLKFGLRGAGLFGGEIFTNENFRIGGIQTLRGFDEESIFANAYIINTIEWRYILEKNAYTYLFFDGAYYERQSSTSFTRDLPFGFGAGISFETKPGIFTINYALGSQQRNPIEFTSAKIHFGFVNYF